MLLIGVGFTASFTLVLALVLAFESQTWSLLRDCMAYFMNPLHGDCYAKPEHALVVTSSGCISIETKV